MEIYLSYDRRRVTTPTYSRTPLFMLVLTARL